MKKYLRCLFTLLITVCLTGCGNKKFLSSNEFKTEMENNGYSVQDATEQFADYDYVKQVYIAVNNDYQIEFYELDSLENARVFYETNKAIFESSKSSSSIQTNNSVGNHSKYTLNTDGKYKVISQIENTAIYINVDDEYKNDVKSILKKIGY